MAAAPPKTPRLLRMAISLYRNPGRTAPEAYDYAVNNFAIQAAKIHAKHGILGYNQVFTPLSVRQTMEEMNRRRNRNWVVDDHDMTVEFYFRSFAELAKVTNDPDFQRLQTEEEPYINRTHTVCTLGWVETYVENGQVVNVGQDDRSLYGSWEESVDLSTAMPQQPAPPTAGS